MKSYKLLLLGVILSFSINTALADRQLWYNVSIPPVSAKSVSDSMRAKVKVDPEKVEKKLIAAFSKMRESIDYNGVNYDYKIRFKRYPEKILYKKKVRKNVNNLKKFTMALPFLADMMADRILYELSSKSPHYMIIYRKYWEFYRDGMEEVYAKASKSDNLHELGRYYIEKIDEIVQNRIDKKPISQNERDSLIQGISVGLEKTVPGTAYEHIDVKSAATHFVDRQFLINSPEDAKTNTKAMQGALEQITKTTLSALEAMNYRIAQAGNPNWKDTLFLSLMDKMGLSPGAGKVKLSKATGKVKLSKLTTEKANSPINKRSLAKDFVNNAKKLGNLIGGKYKHTPTMDKRYIHLTEMSPEKAEKYNNDIKKLLNNENKGYAKSMGKFLLEIIKTKYRKLYQANK